MQNLLNLMHYKNEKDNFRSTEDESTSSIRSYLHVCMHKCLRFFNISGNTDNTLIKQGKNSLKLSTQYPLYRAGKDMINSLVVFEFFYFYQTARCLGHQIFITRQDNRLAMVSLIVGICSNPISYLIETSVGYSTVLIYC